MKSKYHNVYWYRRTGRWLVKLHARSNRSGKATINLGYYQDEEVAARVSDVAELLVRGPDARLNFDGQPPPNVPRAQIVAELLDKGVILSDHDGWGVRAGV